MNKLNIILEFYQNSNSPVNHINSPGNQYAGTRVEVLESTNEHCTYCDYLLNLILLFQCGVLEYKIKYCRQCRGIVEI